MEPEIKNMTDPDLRLVGPACTVKCYPGDNLMVHKALDVAQPGDVVVVDTSSTSLTAVLGDLVCTKARHRGIAGFIVDGLIRDLPAIRRLGDFPVFARDVTPKGPLHRGPGEIGYPISCGGIVVNPGDVIVADLNGVVVVPRDISDELLMRLDAKAAKESDYVSAVARGDFNNDWVDAMLEASGVETRQPAKH
jgi:regulator of RNase E activity RraA